MRAAIGLLLSRSSSPRWSMSVTDDSAPPLALYIHWPFCIVKCPYCDFNSHVRGDIDVTSWRRAFLADLAHEAALLPGRRLGSIFFGGGTPSLMPPQLIGALIDAATAVWTPMPDLEITLEANPNSAEASRFADVARAGVNRLSLGIQSFDDTALRFLGRAHDSGEGVRAIAAAQASVARVSIDLIYALPGQGLDVWSAELDRAIGYGTDHLSLYQLTIEPGTRFATMARRGVLRPVDDDHAALLFEHTQLATAAAGLPAYEISNHARPGRESHHNLTYWRYRDYVGIGPGAHGRRLGQGSRRHPKPENYLRAVARNGHGIVETIVLGKATRAVEALLTGLRLAEGVDIAGIAAATALSPDVILSPAAVARVMGLGLIEWCGTRLCLTPRGRPLLDAILAEIVAIEDSCAA